MVADRQQKEDCPGPYPGDVNTPMDIQVESLEGWPAGTQYGDIIIFGLVDGKHQQGMVNRLIPHVIHPDQKYRLVLKK